MSSVRRVLRAALAHWLVAVFTLAILFGLNVQLPASRGGDMQVQISWKRVAAEPTATATVYLLMIAPDPGGTGRFSVK